MTTRPPAEVRFKVNILGITELATEIINIIQEYKLPSPISGFVITLANGILDGLDNVTLIEGFIDRTYPYWDLIKNKDPSFTKCHLSKIFGAEDQFKDQIDNIVSLFDFVNRDTFITDRGTALNTEDTQKFKEYLKNKNTEFWDIMIPCVKISISYIHNARVPIFAADGTFTYSESKYPYIKVKSLAEAWGAKLL